MIWSLLLSLVSDFPCAVAVAGKGFRDGMHNLRLAGFKTYPCLLNCVIDTLPLDC